MNKYPFIEQLGLVVRKDFNKGINLLYADDLEALLKKAVKVYGRVIGVHRFFGESYADKYDKQNTHSALLINIQPLKPKCEKHEPPKNYNSTKRIFCVNCNKELEPEWKAVEWKY